MNPKMEVYTWPGQSVRNLWFYADISPIMPNGAHPGYKTRVLGVSGEILLLAFAAAAFGLALAENVLRDLIGSEKIKPITVEQVQRTVAEHYDVRIADLRGRSRQRQVVQPRQLAMYLCKTLIPSLSLNDIGEHFGGKDHTTVLYACDKVSKDIAANSVVRQTVEQLSKSMRS